MFTGMVCGKSNRPWELVGNAVLRPRTLILLAPTRSDLSSPRQHRDRYGAGKVVGPVIVTAASRLPVGAGEHIHHFLDE